MYDSGGTTGSAKRVVLRRDWLDMLVARSSAQLDTHSVPPNVNWLMVIPSGPYLVGATFIRQVVFRGGLPFIVDMAPRWVKKLISEGKSAEADAYTEHLADQLTYPPESQDIGVLMLTPPVLEKLTHRDNLIALVRKKVKAIMWVSTQMDADTRHLRQSERPCLPPYSTPAGRSAGYSVPPCSVAWSSVTWQIAPQSPWSSLRSGYSSPQSPPRLVPSQAVVPHAEEKSAVA